MESPIDTNSEADLSDFDHNDAFIEDERELSSSSTSCDEVGPYAGEPLADEEWLREYRQEKEKADARRRHLQERMDGVSEASTW